MACENVACELGICLVTPLGCKQPRRRQALFLHLPQHGFADDERARQILERTDSMPAEQFMKLHGAVRGLRPLKESTP